MGQPLAYGWQMVSMLSGMVRGTCTADSKGTKNQTYRFSSIQKQVLLGDIQMHRINCTCCRLATPTASQIVRYLYPLARTVIDPVHRMTDPACLLQMSEMTLQCFNIFPLQTLLHGKMKSSMYIGTSCVCVCVCLSVCVSVYHQKMCQNLSAR